MASVTLQDLILDIGAALGDNLTGTTTGDSTPVNQFRDTLKAAGSADRWVNSEVLFLDTLGQTGINPNTITAFDEQNGIFTMRDVWNTSAGVPAGRRYVLMNLRGGGKPFYFRKQAVKHVLGRESGTYLRAIVGVYNQYDWTYTIPDNFEWVYDVKLERDELLAPTQQFNRYHVSNPRWELQPGRKLFLQDSYAPLDDGTYSLVLYGIGSPAFSEALSSSYNVRSDLIVQDAVEWLTLLSELSSEQAANNRLFQERVREDFDYRHPGARKVIP